MNRWRILWVVKGFFFILIFSLLAGLAVMLLWNALIPEIFNGPKIEFFQAIGLLILARLLAGGFGGWRRHCGCGHHHGGYWRKRWEARMAGMSPEEKEQFLKRVREKCGYGWSESEEEKTPPVG